MRRRYILLDIETQRDFFSPGGSCYSKDAAAARSCVYDLFDWARINSLPILSTVLRVRRSEPGPLADVPHCVEASDGERKLARTLLRNRINLGIRNITDLPSDLLRQYRQVIFEKRHSNIFSHARAERLITQLDPSIFVVCGAGLARSIVEAVIGLLNRDFGVIVAADAVLGLGDRHAEMACLRMEAKGALFLPTWRIITAGTKIHHSGGRYIGLGDPGRKVIVK